MASLDKFLYLWMRYPIIPALALDLLYPEHTLFNLFLVIAGSLVDFIKAVHWTLAGYVDVLYLSDDHRQARTRVFLGLGVPTARRILVVCWVHAKTAFYVVTWKRAVAVMALGLCCVASHRFFSIVWRKRVGDAWESAQLWAILGPTTLVYGATVVGWIILKNADEAMRAVTHFSLPSIPPFSYSSAPNFDPSTQIRLLRLDRRLPFSEVSGKLVSYSLRDAPAYHAISYTWSHGPQTYQHIKLNDMSLRVRSNVYDILLRCSSCFGPQFIWLDSICIDQTSLSEKTVQVRRMKEIYERAAHVLVCLGNGPGRLALGLLEELKMLQQYFDHNFMNTYVLQFISHQRTDLYLRARVKALVELMQHAWFKRAWVVQEVVVAQQVTFCYGQQSIPFLQLQKLYDVLSEHLAYVLVQFDPQSEVLQTMQSHTGSVPFMAAFRAQYSQQGPCSISHLLRVFGDKEASVPIDKVFALIGMARSYSSGSLMQLVNYVDTAQTDILLDLAHFLFDNDEALDVFDLAGTGWKGGSNSNLPSWAVDWTTVRSGMPVLSRMGSSAARYHATKGTLPRIKRGGSRWEMVVKGKYVDRIRSILPIQSTETGMKWPLDTQKNPIFSYLDDALDLARKDIRGPYLDQPLDEAVWRTLIGDKTQLVRPAPGHYGRVIRSVVQLWQETADVARSSDPRMIVRQDVAETLRDRWGAKRVEEIQQDAQDLNKVDPLFDSRQSGQTYMFCTTESGYIAMVPELSQVGDIVCLIYGLDVPYVMRKVEGRFRLVGTSYVHGLMDGQGLDLPHEDEEFVLF